MKGRARLGLAVNVDTSLKKEPAEMEKAGKALSAGALLRILAVCWGQMTSHLCPPMMRQCLILLTLCRRPVPSFPSCYFV